MDDEDAAPNRCAACHKRIRLGDDVLTIERAVLGPRGVVPLGSPVVLCSDTCGSEYFDDPDAPPKYTMHRKVP